jgi:hypothetical protein
MPVMVLSVRKPALLRAAGSLATRFAGDSVCVVLIESPAVNLEAMLSPAAALIGAWWAGRVGIALRLRIRSAPELYEASERDLHLKPARHFRAGAPSDGAGLAT